MRVLMDGVIPQSSVSYRGARSPGWLTFGEVQAVPGIRICRVACSEISGGAEVGLIDYRPGCR